MSDPRFVVVIPALNAAMTIQAVVEEALHHLPTVVVNDGSTDETESHARDAGAIVLRHERNQGKGAALKTGFAWALANGYDAVVTLDADGQHRPSEIPLFCALYERTMADLIIGDRSHLFPGMVRRRRAANRFSAWAISRCAGATVPDSQSGFRVYSSRLLRSVRLESTGFDAESEVIVRAARAGLTIQSMPVDLGFIDGVSTSHYRPVADTLRIAWTVTKTRFGGR